jgi:hypothetical protein
MASQLDVTKLVAQHLNERWDNIDSTTDGIVAREVNLVFDDEFQLLLKAYPWVFAMRYTYKESANLTVDLPPPWLSVFNYPAHASKVWGFVNPRGADHPPLTFQVAYFDRDGDDVDEHVIFAMISEGYIRYTLDSASITDADEYFVKALSYTIAGRIAFRVTGSDALKVSLSREALMSVSMAYANNAIEDAEPDRDIDPVWLQVRG